MISVETERELQSSSRSAMDSFISLASKLGETCTFQQEEYV